MLYGRSPRNILLTGAGFTKNFGGLLASDVWERVFNNPVVRRHRALIDLEADYYPDFESVYQMVVEGDYSEGERSALNSAIADVYSGMDETLRNYHRSNASTKPDLSGVARLVCLFTGSNEESGYFFTLNQDLFVERFIVDKTVGKAHQRQLLPLGFGMRPGYTGPHLGQGILQPGDRRVLPTKQELAAIQENARRNRQFAYIKLHGSANWLDSQRRGAMVIGGAKEDQIDQEPLLRWYLDLFEQVLLERRHRLLVIGYSFRDPHINRALARAIDGPGLEIAVLSPQSWSAFDSSLSDSAGEYMASIKEAMRAESSRYFPYDLATVFPSGLFGDMTQEWQEIRGYLQQQ